MQTTIAVLNPEHGGPAPALPPRRTWPPTRTQPPSLEIIVERFRFGVEFDLAVLKRVAHCASRSTACVFAEYPCPLFSGRSSPPRNAGRGSLAFDTDIVLRGCGRLIRYQGWVPPH